MASVLMVVLCATALATPPLAWLWVRRSTFGTRVAIASVWIGVSFLVSVAIAGLLLPGGGGAVAPWNLGDGVPLLLLFDQLSVTVLVISLFGAGCVLIRGMGDRMARSRGNAAWLPMMGGVVVAAVAGNLVVLEAGIMMVLLSLVWMQPVRRTWGITRALPHAVIACAALALLTAEVQLSVRTGTVDFSSIPVGAITGFIGAPWLLAASGLIVAPLVAAAVGATRCERWLWLSGPALGVVVMGRLIDSQGGAPVASLVGAGGDVCAVALVVVGVLWITLSHRGRALIEGSMCALGGFILADIGAGPQAGWGIASAAALLLLVASVVLGCDAARSRTQSRGLAMLVLGLFPGSGASVLALLTINAVAVSDVSVWYPVLDAVLLGGACVMSAAAVRWVALIVASWRVTSRREQWESAIGGVCAAVAMACPVLVAVDGVLPLGWGAPPSAQGSSALLALGGGWGGAYIVVAWTVLGGFYLCTKVVLGDTAGGVATSMLSAVPRTTARRTRPAVVARAVTSVGWPHTLEEWGEVVREHVGLWVGRGLGVLDALDGLMGRQPRLGAIVLGTIVCLLVFR